MKVLRDYCPMLRRLNQLMLIRVSQLLTLNFSYLLGDIDSMSLCEGIILLLTMYVTLYVRDNFY